MTDKFKADLRRVDEIAVKAGEAIRILDQEGRHDRTATLRMVYWLAVAVWHLLDKEIKRGGDTCPDRPLTADPSSCAGQGEAGASNGAGRCSGSTRT